MLGAKLLNAARELAYNLGSFLRKAGDPEPIKEWSLTSLKVKLVKFGAKTMSHGRVIACQIAEVFVSRRIYLLTSCRWLLTRGR